MNEFHRGPRRGRIVGQLLEEVVGGPHGASDEIDWG